MANGGADQVLRDAPGFSHGEVSRCLRSRQSIWCSPQGWDTPGFSHGEDVTTLLNALNELGAAVDEDVLIPDGGHTYDTWDNRNGITVVLIASD